jgi:hypothetical protein
VPEPSTKATPSFADDLAAVRAEQAQPTASFADDLAAVRGERPPDFTVTNEPPDPSLLAQAGRFASEVGSAINPVTAVKAVGEAVMSPVETVKGIGAAQGALYDKARDAYEKGDYVGAAAHFVNYLLPLVGPSLDVAGEKLREGDVGGGAGQAVGLGLSLFGPQALSKLPKTSVTTRPLIKPQLNPQEAAAVQFGRAEGVPIDLATAGGNRFVRGVQKLADESMLGSPVGGRARAAQAHALTATGERLAERALPTARTPELAGRNLAISLESKVEAHHTFANASYDKLRALEAAKPQAMQVDLKATKQALQPVYDQLRRQMPITQQQANPGLKAMQNIIEGPDVAPLSQIDRDLSAIKTVAREQGGVAKFAVSKLDSAVQQAAARGGPDAMRALQQGRQAIVAREATRELLDTLRAEPVQAYRQMVAPKDSGIDLLRTVAKETPQALPSIARAYLDDLLNMATAEGGFARADRLQAEWRKLGTETKKVLFPQPGQTQALDHFFLLAKRIAENPNPSGTAFTAFKGGEIGLLIAQPWIGVPLTLSAPVVSTLLHSPKGVRALTRGFTLSLNPSKATPAAQAAAIANIRQAAKELELELPKAADEELEGRPVAVR